MMKATLQICFALIALCARVSFASGRYVEISYPPSSDADGLQVGVTFTLWIPDGVERVRGLIVHQHGCGSGACQGGQTAAYDLHWQALAQKWNCGLLGPSYHQVDGDQRPVARRQNCRLWCDPRNGSEKAFLTALADLAEKAQHPELNKAPWCLWGHSGGAFWASLMQTMHPERIAAIWFRSGGAYAAWEKGEIPKPEIPDAAYQIPMMCNPGAKEEGDKRFNGAYTGAMAMFRAYRAKGAPIGFAADPRTSHECGDSRYLAIPFFDACLAMRLPDNRSPDQALKPIDQRPAWLARVPGDEALPASSFQGDALEAAWLPNERIAKAWMEYVKTGSVGDATPPPVPAAVKVVADAKGGAALTWQAAADFESGLQAFVVLRDGEQLGQVPEQPLGRFGRPLFQTMSYHDTPERPLPEMRFVDAAAKSGERHKYQVVAVNSVGLRSESSLAASPASQTAAAAATLHVEVRETAGIRRFGYPIALKLPAISLDAAHARLRDGNNPAPAQFRKEETDSGGGQWWLDFNVSMLPNERRVLTLEYGPNVAADPEPPGLEIKQTPDGLEIRNASHLVWNVGRGLQCLLKSVRAGELECLRPEGLRLGIEGPQGVFYARGDAMVLPRVIRSGPLTVAIRYALAPKAGQLTEMKSTVDLTFPVSKSWVQVDWSIDDPRRLVKSARAEIAQKLDPPTQEAPTLVDFGASSLVYMSLAPGTAGALKASTSGTETPVRQSWKVLRGTREGLAPFVARSGGAGGGEAEGWSHIMDRHQCLALAIGEFGKGGADSIEVTAEGDVAIARNFSTGGADLPTKKNVRFWLHFVDFPPHVGAATSPQSMLSPLSVRIRKP